MARNRSKLGDKTVRHDRFHERAKREGFRARAVFKLEELDRAHHLFGKGDRVLDLGCAPGSWLQYAGTRVGPTGALVGIDRVAITGVAHARLLVGDIYEVTPEELRGELAAAMAAPARSGGVEREARDSGAPPETSRIDAAMFYDVVLSDMAPDTTGVRHVDQARSEALFERALDLALALLAPGGHFVGKLFQGPDFKKLTERCRLAFTEVRTVKPESSRQFSIEQYVVAKGRRA